LTSPNICTNQPASGSPEAVESARFDACTASLA
jgi:hypothetical protein